MSIALFSDIHGNIVGMHAVLEYISRLGAETAVAAGDIISGSSGCGDLLDLLAENRVDLIRGNSEETLLDLESSRHLIPEKLHAYIADLHEWQKPRYSNEHLQMLRDAPLSRTYTLPNGHRLLVCHASPQNPWHRICRPDVPANLLRETFGPCGADVIAYGHYHSNHVIRLDEKLLVNVASVGFRTDGLCMCTFIDDAQGYVMVQQHAIPFDAEGEAELNGVHGVPEFYTT